MPSDRELMKLIRFRKPLTGSAASGSVLSRSKALVTAEKDVGAAKDGIAERLSFTRGDFGGIAPRREL